MLFVIYFLFALNTALCQWPHNQVVTVGKEVTMFCRSEKYQLLQWRNRLNTDDEWKTIADKLNISKQLGRFKSNSSDEVQYDLIINGTQLSDSGTYSCVVRQNYSLEIQYEAELVVLASDPLCSTSVSELNDPIVENEHIQIRCTVKYQGRPKLVPTMELSQEGRKPKVVSENHTIDNIYAKSVFVVKIDSSDHESHFVFKTYFKVPAVTNQTTEFIITSTNSPTYTFTWISPTINVSFSPRNIRVTVNGRSDPDNVTYVVVGDLFECFADGNPTPEYSWIIDGEEIIRVNGSKLILSERMLENTEIAIRCTAKNDFGQVSISVNFTVSNGTVRMFRFTPDLDITAITIASIATSFFLTMAIIVYQRIRSRKENYSENSLETENKPPVPSKRNVNSPQQYHRPVDEDIQLEETDDNDVGLETKKPSDAGNASVIWKVPLYTDGETGDDFGPVARSCIAAYEEVDIGNEEVDIGDKHQSNHRSESDATEEPRKTEKEQIQIIGADGTVYTEVKVSGENQNLNSMKNQKRKPLYKKSSYVQIDHTLKPLPAPPKFTTGGKQLNLKN